MKRRLFLSGLLGLPFASGAHADQAWSAELLSGNFDGTAFQAGLHIKLQPGWKTYWRNPGEAGIPPAIKVIGDNLASFIVDAPLPLRIIDESGEAIGYHDEVLFPIRIMPKDLNAPLSIKLSSFFGVCAKVCTPAKFEREASFGASSDPAVEQLLATWRAKVPIVGEFIASSNVRDGQLNLLLNTKVDDIFVEGPDQFYFRKPDFSLAPNAFIKVDGLKNDAALRGVKLRLTASIGGKGLEQWLTLA